MEDDLRARDGTSAPPGATSGWRSRSLVLWIALIAHSLQLAGPRYAGLALHAVEEAVDAWNGGAIASTLAFCHGRARARVLTCATAVAIGLHRGRDASGWRDVFPLT